MTSLVIKDLTKKIVKLTEKVNMLETKFKSVNFVKYLIFQIVNLF